MRILGVTASGIVGFDPSYELIQTTTLASDTNSVTFDNLNTYSSTYKHLQVRFVGRSTASVATTRLGMRINSASSGYSHHGLFTRGSGTPISYAAPNFDSLRVCQDLIGASELANASTAMILDILDPFSTTKNKTTRSLYGHTSTSNNLIGMSSGLLISTNAITSLSFASTNSAYNDGGNFLAGSRFSLYGIKG